MVLIKGWMHPPETKKSSRINANHEDSEYKLVYSFSVQAIIKYWNVTTSYQWILYVESLPT